MDHRFLGNDTMIPWLQDEGLVAIEFPRRDVYANCLSVLSRPCEDDPKMLSLFCAFGEKERIPWLEHCCWPNELVGRPRENRGSRNTHSIIAINKHFCMKMFEAVSELEESDNRNPTLLILVR